MNVKEYHQVIMEMADIDVEAESIADSRRIINEIDERQDILKKIHSQLKKDIRTFETYYMDQKREINLKYTQGRDSRVLRVIRGDNRVKALKKLEEERDETLESYRYLLKITEYILEEMEQAKEPLQNFVLNRLGL